MSVVDAIAGVLATFLASVSLTLFAVDVRNRRNRKAPRNLPPSLADDCSPWSERETR